MSQKVKIETTLGSFVVELYTMHAPKTCRNFHTLASRGYYNGTIFHRVIPGFVIQGGDPSGTGKGGDSIYGGAFEDEIHPGLKHVGAGILSMANAGPNTNKSQFFVTLGPTSHLDGKHTIFGRVYSGMATMQRIGAVPTNEVDRPREDIKIIKAEPFTEEESETTT